MLDAVSGLSKPLVLVVEDEAALATMLRYNLEKQGFRVEEAARRAGGTDPHRRDAARPGAAGLDAAGDVRHRGVPSNPPQASTRDLPVIMGTARTEDQKAAASNTYN